jgi:hypothetical protein
LPRRSSLGERTGHALYGFLNGSRAPGGVGRVQVMVQRSGCADRKPSAPWLTRAAAAASIVVDGTRALPAGESSRAARNPLARVEPMSELRKVVIFAPFWRDETHVGSFRVARFIRWLRSCGAEILVVRAGSTASVQSTGWGSEITVPDPFKFYGDVGAAGRVELKPRKPNRLRRFVGYWLFNPDPTVVWACSAAANRSVRDLAAGSEIVLSSSPPESSHVGAARLARAIGARFCADLRDGWLDEPLRPVLQDSRLRQWQEARLERSILLQAERVFVTSEVWREKLVARLSPLQNRVHVLTNAYPDTGMPSRSGPCSQDEIVLVHAGRFTGSRSTSRPRVLLEPLAVGLQASSSFSRGRVVLIGRHEGADCPDIEEFRRRLSGTQWSVEVRPHVARSELMQLLVDAHGLLLLSTSEAPIPSKLFEYIPARRPILVVTPRGSGTWRASAELPQAVTLEPGTVEGRTVAAVERFLQMCAADEVDAEVPIQFGEQALCPSFLSALDLTIS